jgi:Xaa-Pro dipeptidase
VLNVNKISDLAKSMADKDINALFVGPSSDLQYLTGLSPFADERFKALVILADGRYFYICPALYLEETKKEIGEDIKIYVWDDSSGFLNALKEVNKDFDIEGKRIAVNEGIRAIDLLDIKQLIPAEYVKACELLGRLRIIKDETEQENMRKAAEIIDEAVVDLTKFIRPGMTEKDVKDRLEDFCLERGSSFSFPPIIASGPNSSMPHYNDYSRRIQEKDIVILDIGCVYNGYCSDTTRTVFVGEPTEEQKKVYNVVLEANKQAEQFVREGVKASDIDKKARSVIEDAGYGEYFVHRTGHGIGVAVHEEPYIMQSNDMVIEEGMAFSIEPGIYLPGKFGVRIEDIVIAKKDGAEVLNKSPKDDIIIIK